MLPENTPKEAFIDGRWALAPKTFTLRRPDTGAPLAEVADVDAETARKALEAQIEADAHWRKQTPAARGAVLRRWYELILEHAEPLARIMALEMGKPIREGRKEVAYAAGFVEWYAEEAKRIYGTTIPSPDPAKRLMVIKAPVGPVYAITPWNFPAAMVTRKAAPALAAGCTVTLKPAEESPLTALYLARLWQEAGGPPATLQVLPTTDPVGVSRVFLEDPRIRKLTFTGSTAVGQQLYAQAAKTMKRIALELGGHAPFIAFEDADLEKAVAAAITAKFRNGGQSCVAANRIYVHRAIHDRFAEAFAEAVGRLRVGDPLDEATEIGPLVNAAAAAKVEAHLSDALARGARLLGGGKRRGTFVEPAVLARVPLSAKILEEETFGPVAPILSFEREEEALAMANASPYGLAAYLWTRDLGRAWRMSEGLEFGIVGVNDGLPSTPVAPFGGMKLSGIGREGGKWGLDAFLEIKYVSVVIT